ncbi:MAG: glycosyltransferase [Cryobacterium sp.]|nr:glycosyltransferase [Cryobacterium sp.]
MTILTAKPPKDSRIDDPPGIEIRRTPVKRDRQQYVRGYLSYMSFDIPLAFRLLFSPRADIYVVEPPPTTVAVVRLIAALRRTPYVVRAADYWSEAAELVTRSRLILGFLRRVEAWGLNGASLLFSAHQPLTERLRKAGVITPAVPIGFGADTKDFRYENQKPPKPPIFIYAGTHSEWHGAGIFIEAMPEVLETHPGARLLFFGNGEDRESLESRAEELGISSFVKFNPPIPPSELSPILAGATASVASLSPVPANEYALATKVYSSLAAGCPVIFAGPGPTIEFLSKASHRNAGFAVEYDVKAVSAAMSAVADTPLSVEKRIELARWSSAEFSLPTIARRVVDECLKIINE